MKERMYYKYYKREYPLYIYIYIYMHICLTFIVEIKKKELLSNHYCFHASDKKWNSRIKM